MWIHSTLLCPKKENEDWHQQTKMDAAYTVHIHNFITIFEWRTLPTSQIVTKERRRMTTPEASLLQQKAAEL